MTHSYRKHGQGQGLVEFALILPLLLIVFIGIAEFGRMFAIYSNLFNAAREGSRYGIVNPLDTDGIIWATWSKMALVDPYQVETVIQYDSGPDTPTKTAPQVRVGDRVVVHLSYDFEPMLPFLAPLMSDLVVETTAARTISSVGVGGIPTPPGTPGTPGTPTATATQAQAPLSTPTPTHTTTPGTPTPTPNVPIVINTPVVEGDTLVSGTALAGQTLSLRDIQDPSVTATTVVDANGRFTFRLQNGLISGHVIVVEGYGKTSWTVVERKSTPTPTPVGTATPTATPVVQYIMLQPTCGPIGSNTITVYGYQWVVMQGDKLSIFVDGIKVADEKNINADGSFSELVTVNASTAKTYTVVARWTKNTQISASTTFQVPCPGAATPTPTPTPSYPNLIVQSLTIQNQSPIKTFDPLTFTVRVSNIGNAAVNNLFWVDLYINPSATISPTNPAAETSVAWVAISSLEAGRSITISMIYSDGIPLIGSYPVYAMVDTLEKVYESNEMDNVYGPVTLNVSQASTPPTPTPTPTPIPIANGAASGSTWISLNGDIVAQGRVDVYCYDSNYNLVAQTISDQNGLFHLDNIPPGVYTMIGQTTINDRAFTGLVTNITINSGQTTQYITLTLY